MKKDRLFKFLKMLGSPPVANQSRGGWTIASCPLRHWRHDGGTDKNPAFAVRDENGDAFCNCFACDWHGNLSTLILEMRRLNKTQPAVTVPWGEAFELIEQAEDEGFLNLDTPDIEDMLFGEKRDMHEFPSWWLGSFPKWREIGFSRDYVKERGIDPDVADFLDLRADTEQARLCFPIKDFAGRLRGLHGRAVTPETQPRYRMYTQAGLNNPIVWLGESWVDMEKPILVVEGPMDLAACLRVYPNTVSPLFASPSQEKLSRMADALEWVTLLDRGKGGDAGRTKIRKALSKDHLVTDLEPPNGRKDPGECSEHELRELLSPHLHLAVST